MKDDRSWQNRLDQVLAEPLALMGTGPFARTWRPFMRYKDEGVPVEGAVGVIWIDDGWVHALAVMTDSDVYSRATGRRARTWESGDVLELFVHPDSSLSPYFEFHVAPSGAALSLHIPDAVKLRADTYPFERLLYDSVGFAWHHGTFSAGWWGHTQVPLEEIGLRDPVKARACLCRYNYNKAWPHPEQSTTARMAGCVSFHTPECWHPLDA